MYRSETLRIGPRRGATTVTLNVGLVIPMHGPAGIFGLSCLACAVLAGEEINEAGGLLGREVRLVPIDGAGPPDTVAERVEAARRRDGLAAVTGWHLSHVRCALAARLHGEMPYVYGALYEGGEHSPGVYLTGETPERQIAPSMAWMARELGIRRWAVVGDDYLWPRGSANAVHEFVHAMDLQLVDEIFVPLGQRSFGLVMQRLQRSPAQAVLMLLVGQDAVHFNRAFTAAGLDQRMVRLSSLMDENMLLASGAEATTGVFSAAGYFSELTTADALELSGRYGRRFGPDAPVLTSMGESCYEAMQLLATLLRSAGTLDMRAVGSAAEEPLGFHGPRGSVHLENRHLRQPVYLARANGGVFDVVTEL